MSDDVLVRVDNVSKRFCRSLKRSLWYGLQDLGSEIGGRRHGGGGGLPQSSADVELRKDEFWAVKDVSFELRRGECLGLIGRNGAGKTTLLRMLNGLIKPDTGSIHMMGNIGALIALGAGFNPILTGRENIKISMSIMGMSAREAKLKTQQIIDFAEISEYIDSPVQSYSSGMVVRLGFAANVLISPDILILDEVLAVGDAAFRSKCYQKIQELGSSAATLLVSHDSGQLQTVCSEGLLLNKGTSNGKTGIAKALEEYELLTQEKLEGTCRQPVYRHDPAVIDFKLNIINMDETRKLSLDASIESKSELKAKRIQVNIATKSLIVVANVLQEVNGTISRGLSNIGIIIDDLSLCSGSYYVNLVIYSADNTIVLHYANQLEVNIKARPSMWNCHYQPIARVIFNNIQCLSQ
jgi:ABC-type polysaccharide/polyol phosphate transport system ATPase subunit